MWAPGNDAEGCATLRADAELIASAPKMHATLTKIQRCLLEENENAETILSWIDALLQGTL